MTPTSRAIMLAASSLAVLLTATPAYAAPAEPLVQTGDINVLTGDYDIFEDVLEHISMVRGNGNTTTHQLYDNSVAAPAE
jgi:hypothetical protein